MVPCTYQAKKVSHGILERNRPIKFGHPHHTRRLYALVVLQKQSISAIFRLFLKKHHPEPSYAALTKEKCGEEKTQRTSLETYRN